MNKKSSIVLVVVLAVIAGWLALRYYAANRPVANQFAGVIKSFAADGKSFSAAGWFLDDGKALVSQNGKDKDVEMRIVIAPSTAIVQIGLHLPSERDLVKTGGRYNPKDLKREEIPVTIDDLKKLLGSDQKFIATAEGNIYGNSSFAPTRIEYIEPIYPPTPTY